MNDLKSITARLEKLKKKKAIDKENIEKKVSINYSIAVNISIELITGIALGTFFGLVIDNYLQTKPLMLIIFFIIGTLVGFYNMYKTLKKYKLF
ncbi:AtpZ/AtpI family protein [Alphaproteobacteria bacterium]|nr:AtpZ/AtpI family protein [Alphaproteobacteria bacterium]